MELKFKRTIVLGAHTDDEFGCSGTIIRLLESGVEVYYAVFSTCEESVPDGWPPDTLYHELLRATECLGLPRDQLFIYHYPVRHFPEHRQEILEELVQIKNELQPDLVLLPASVDIHQDHRVMSEEGVRAFKHSTILGYELPMNNIQFRHACYVALEESHMQRKIESLMCYASQASRNYRNEEFIRGLGRVRGVQINGTYAEAFEVIRLIIR
jgi:LmbE family N-acetylglucosaminyl deacetylase